MAKSIERVTRAKKNAKRAEKLKGEDRRIAKEELRYATLEERHRSKLVKERIYELRQQRQYVRAHTEEGKKLQALRPINEALTKNIERLRTVNKQSNETQKQAADQIGPKFAGFLRKASREALNLGSNLKVTAKRQRELNEEEEQFMQARSEGYKTIGEAEEGGNVRGPGPRLGEPHHGGLKHPGANSSGRNADALHRPRRRLNVDDATGDSLRRTLQQGDIHITVKSELDGKVVAENVAKHAARAAARGGR